MSPRKYFSTISLLALSCAVTASPVPAAADCAALYGQCGGSGWTGPTCCSTGTCQVQNQYYSQCLGGGGGTSPPPNPKPKYAGVNIAGFDFGEYDTCGSQPGAPYPPLAPSGPDGIGQMNHFVKDDGLNAFRLPVTWQYLVNNNINANQLDPNRFATYNQLVQGCLSSGASLCIIDLHNYARYNGAIIGQNGPTAQQFASLWGQIATKYANQPKIAFDLMNEPNDNSQCGNIDMPTWSNTMQAAVTAIRNAGATSQMIILTGKEFSHSLSYLDNSGSADAVLRVTNPGGSKTNLIIAVHEYLDSDDSGKGGACVTNNTNTSYNRGGFANLASWLRRNGRQAFLAETGGSPNDTTCISYLRQELGYLNANGDVFLGWTGWAAGSFKPGDPLSETPSGGQGNWQDQPLVKQAIAACFTGTCP